MILWYVSHRECEEIHVLGFVKYSCKRDSTLKNYKWEKNPDSLFESNVKFFIGTTFAVSCAGEIALINDRYTANKTFHFRYAIEAANLVINLKQITALCPHMQQHQKENG